MTANLALVFLVLLALAPAIHAFEEDNVIEIAEEGPTGRKLTAACTLWGVRYTQCRKMSHGTAGFSLSGTTLSVGFYGNGGWAGFAVGNPHAGASVVLTKGTKTARVTMNSFPPLAVFISPSKVKFASVVSKRAGARKGATFKMPFRGSTLKITLAAGPGTTVQLQHALFPVSYTLKKAGLTINPVAAFG